MTTNRNPTVPVSLDALAVGRSNTSPFLTIYETRNPNTNDVNYPIQQRWYNTVLESEWILTGYSVVSEVKTAIWQPIGGSAIAITETLTGNSGGAVGVDGANNINVIGDTTTINIVGNPGTHTLTASTAGTVATLYTENTGTATPSAGNLNVVGSGSTTTTGSGSTVTVQLTGLTNHAVLVGAGTTTITKVGPGATGTVLAGNTGADPSFQTTTSLGLIRSLTNRVFTTSGTYTPTANMVYCSIQCLGGGGGGSGSLANGAGDCSVGGGGGAGEYAVGIFSAATIGASKTVTIGAAGTGGVGAVGVAGGNTSVGALISAFGGAGGGISGSSPSQAALNGDGGTGGAGGDYRTPGMTTSPRSFGSILIGLIETAAGANSQLGSGGQGSGDGNGNNALGYGAGGSGGGSGSGTGPSTGGNGTAGVVIVTEYIS